MADNFSLPTVPRHVVEKDLDDKAIEMAQHMLRNSPRSLQTKAVDLARAIQDAAEHWLKQYETVSVEVNAEELEWLKKRRASGPDQDCG